MKSTSRLLCGMLFAVLCVFAVTAPRASAAGLGLMDATPPGVSVGSLDIPPGLTQEEVRDVVIVSLIARKYTVKDKSDRHAVGYLNHRGHEATFTFVIRHPDAVEMYCDAYTVKKNGQRGNPEMPDGWIKNLKNDITRRMLTKQATK